VFDTAEECDQKLKGCIVIRDRAPFYIFEARTAQSVLGKIPGNSDLVEVPLSELNIRNLGDKLGYMNVDTYGGVAYKEATYLMRQAIRRSTQGLSSLNVHVSGFKGDNSPDRRPTGPVRFDESIWRTNVAALTATINNQYPTVSAIKDQMVKDKSVTSCAFHRWWAIERDPVGPFYLNYKTQRVGYTEDFERYVFQDRFKFLREDLKEMRVA
jgi:hypothetical protein